MKKILDTIFRKKKKRITRELKIIENGKERWIRTDTRRF